MPAKQAAVSIASKPLFVEAFGVSFALESNHARLLSNSLTYLPQGWKRSRLSAVPTSFHLFREGPASFALYRNHRRLFRCKDELDFLERFRSTTALHVAAEAQDFLFIHAGVVAWRNRTVLIPGRSFSGKTTLVAEMVRAGARYYSDEFAVVDPQGMVHPYAQPLQIRTEDGSQQSSVPVQRLGGTAGCEPLPVSLVVLSRYRHNGSWNPKDISPGLGLLHLLDNTVSARNIPAQALAVLKKVVESARIVKSPRGEASELVHWAVAVCNA